MVLTIRKLGNSLGILFPAQIVEKLHVAEGDKLYVTKTPDGIHLTPYDPDFAETMDLVEEGMRQYRNALRKLAK
jgi:putative addiction module antidote